jgi:hypothetical protein
MEVTKWLNPMKRAIVQRVGRRCAVWPRRVFQPGTIGRTEGVDPPQPQAARISNIDHLKFFWSGYGLSGCIFSWHTLNNGLTIYNARPIFNMPTTVRLKVEMTFTDCV